MTYPEKTYELKIVFASDDVARQIKDDVRNWLIAQGVESFVDGVVDSLDLDHNYDDPGWDPFADHGGEYSPLLIYKYDQGYLEELGESLKSVFGDKVSCQFSEIETEVWTEGWKEGFKPIYSEKFVVYPPWDVPHDFGSKHGLMIEPGMAFGTGQHATTQLCLEDLESLQVNHAQANLLDVGTGTGLLAIAGCKLGFKDVVATDIDGDSVRAAQENGKDNEVAFSVYEGSFPGAPYERARFTVVVANILAVVLKKLMPDLVTKVAEGGYLLMSGILAEESGEMIDRAQAYGLKHVTTNQQEDWVAILLRRES